MSFFDHILYNYLKHVGSVLKSRNHLLMQSVEIQKRVGAYAAALETINKCLSEAICSLLRGRSDGESRTAGLVLSGNEILDTYKYYPEVW